MDLLQIDVYGHLVLHKINTGIWKFRGEGETKEPKSIICDILFCLFLQFKTHISKGANLHADWCLPFAGFL